MFGSLLALPFIGTVFKALGAAIDVATPALKFVVESAIQFIKWFFKGCGVIFDNKSTLAVLAVVVVASGYYFRTWNDAKVVEPFKKDVTILEQNCTPKRSLPKKVRGHYQLPNSMRPNFSFPLNVGN